MVPPSEVIDVDHAIDRATMIASAGAMADRKPVTSVCTFYGESPSGGGNFEKRESCVIPDIGRLDRSYHQGNFACCGGGATSPSTSANVPPGIELRTSGGHYWSVREPAIDSDNFSLTIYCGPERSPGPGCNVRTEVLAHYNLGAQ